MLRRAIGAPVLAIILVAVAAPAADLLVMSTNPPRNLAAAPTTTVSITFDRAVQTSSITADTFRVFGRATGTASGPFTFSNGNATVTLTPSTPFAAGEVVLVNLSHDILAADLTPLRAAGFAYQFRITSQPASLMFTEIETKSTRDPPGTVGTRIYGAMAADLDNDGYADLTTVNEDSADLRVFLNKADGTGMFDPFLTPPLPIGVESSPNEPADFDNDGNVDIAVASTDENSVWIALGNGDGTFDPAAGGGHRQRAARHRRARRRRRRRSRRRQRRPHRQQPVADAQQRQRRVRRRRPSSTAATTASTRSARAT